MVADFPASYGQIQSEYPERGVEHRLFPAGTIAWLWLHTKESTRCQDAKGLIQC